jgi:hypothetical protein
MVRVRLASLQSRTDRWPYSREAIRRRAGVLLSCLVVAALGGCAPSIARDADPEEPVSAAQLSREAARRQRAIEEAETENRRRAWEELQNQGGGSAY